MNLNDLKGNNQLNTNDISKKSFNVWSKEENREIMKCYYLANDQKLPKQSGTFKVWKERNPMIKPHVTSFQLSRQRVELENSMSTSELQNIRNGIPHNHRYCNQSELLTMENIEIIKCSILARKIKMRLNEATFQL